MSVVQKYQEHKYGWESIGTVGEEQVHSGIQGLKRESEPNNQTADMILSQPIVGTLHIV